MIYLVLTGQQSIQGDAPATWTLDKALSEVQQANAADPQFIYQHLMAQIIYAQAHYADAPHPLREPRPDGATTARDLSGDGAV